MGPQGTALTGSWCPCPPGRSGPQGRVRGTPAWRAPCGSPRWPAPGKDPAHLLSGVVGQSHGEGRPLFCRGDPVQGPADRTPDPWREGPLPPPRPRPREVHRPQPCGLRPGAARLFSFSCRRFVLFFAGREAGRGREDTRCDALPFSCRPCRQMTGEAEVSQSPPKGVNRVSSCSGLNCVPLPQIPMSKS